MAEFSKHIGMDVHKETIAVAAAEGEGGAVRYLGEIPNNAEAVRRLLKRLAGEGGRLRFCYEAGPCGYGLYRRIVAAGHACAVVAPALIPRKPGERVKTDRRDSLNLARLDRSGDLTAVWVPDLEQEAMRDLSRAREDMKTLDKQTRQRLSAFLLRQGRTFAGKQRWTQAHFRWIELQKMDSAVQQIVLEEYVAAVRAGQAHTAALQQQLLEAANDWSLGPAAEALTALRGVGRTAAITLLAELGDVNRFENPSQLMGYVGLTPSEHSSGGRRRQGGLTKTGDAHARRMLVECAWAYRFPARKTARIERRSERASAAVRALSWKAQKRLCGRFHRLTARGKRPTVVVAAIARELTGFIWAVVCETQRPGEVPVTA